MKKSIVLLLVVAQMLIAAPAFAKTATTLSAKLSKTSVTYSSPATLTITLKTGGGKRLANKKIALIRDGHTVGTYRTDSRGVLVRKVKHLGTVRWQARYKGSDRYRASTSRSRSTTAKCVVNSSLSKVNSKVYDLKANRKYQFKLSRKAMFFIGSEGNYEQLNQYFKDTSGDHSAWVLTLPWDTTYWVEWDGAAGDTHVWIW